MRFPKSLEADVIRSLVYEPDTCITFPPERYRNGVIVIHRDGLAQRLPRYLYETLNGKPAPRYFLRSCYTLGCQNPNHHEASDRPYQDRTHCPNGHRYTSKNQIPGHGPYRCLRCREARNARRRKGTGGRRNVCAKGHTLTEENVYLWTDKRGIVHRRCKRCMKLYQRNYRMEKK